jgi:hypothetical protein
MYSPINFAIWIWMISYCYIHAYKHTSTHTYCYIFKYIHTYIGTYKHKYICLYIQTNIQAYKERRLLRKFVMSDNGNSATGCSPIRPPDSQSLSTPSESKHSKKQPPPLPLLRKLLPGAIRIKNKGNLCFPFRNRFFSSLESIPSMNGERREITIVARVARWYVYFHTKNTNLVKFWKVLQRKVLVFFAISPLNGLFYGHLVHFVAIWYIFPVLVC